MKSFTYFPTGIKKLTGKRKKKRSLSKTKFKIGKQHKGKGKGKWIRAIRMLNRGKGKFCIPKKGTAEYKKAKALMNRMR